MSPTATVSALANSPFTRHCKARQPWYGSSMQAQPQSVVNGEPVRRPGSPAVLADDGLYRYVPVPPVGRDEDGYLVEDGMSQTDEHLRQTTLWYHALKRRLPGATVCSDLALHYQLGDTDKTLVPDLFVALRAPRREGRQSYKLWEEPVPDLVVEMLSKNTSKADVGSKRATYEHVGVREYWLFDPEGFELPTPLAGQRLRGGRYRPIEADAAGRLRSEVLGLDLHVRNGELRLCDPATGEDLRTFDEAEDRAEAEKDRAEAEERRAEAEERRAEAEERRAEAEERRAEAEERRAEAGGAQSRGGGAQSRGGGAQSRDGGAQSRDGGAQSRGGGAQSRRGGARAGAAATPTEQIRLGRRCFNVGLAGSLPPRRHGANGRASRKPITSRS